MTRDSKCVRRTACSLLLPCLCMAIPSGPRVYEPKTNESLKQEAIPLCFVDIFQGTLALARGVYAAYEAAIDCRSLEFGSRGRLIGLGGAARRLGGEARAQTGSPAGNRTQNLTGNLTGERLRKLGCQITVSEVVAALSESASYLAASASDCVAGVQEGAYCAADVTALLGAIAQVFNMARGVNRSCSGDEGEFEIVADDGARRLREQRLAASTSADAAGIRSEPRAAHNHGARRLSERAKSFFETWREDVVHERLEGAIERIEERERKMLVTECVLDVNQGLAALLRAGLAANQVAKRCKAGLLATDMGRRVCAVDISGLTGSFTFAAEYLSYAAAHCGDPDEKSDQIWRAECVGEIMQLVTSLSCLTAVGAAIPVSCSKTVRDFDEGIAPGRRLAAGASTVLV